MSKNTIKMKGKKALSMLLAVAIILSCWVWVAPDSHIQADAAVAADDPSRNHYLFAYFTGNSSDGQTIHLAVSEDGLKYTALRDNEPVIIPSKGTGAVRDPYIWYDEKTDYYYIIGTDMDSADNQWWDNCNGFLMWRSKDLVNWYDETFINVYDLLHKINPAVEIVHRAWAPQILWDDATQSYIVYFSIDTDELNYPADQLSIVYFRTSDLMDLSQYTDFGDIFAPGYDVNDADIIQHPTNGKWYLFYKPEATTEYPTTKIHMMVADKATGPYTSADSNDTRGLDIYLTDTENPVNEALEGPNAYFDNNGKLVMYADAYGHGSSYFYIAQTPADGDYMTWDVLDNNSNLHNINSLSPRHGSVVKITEAEYQDLLSNEDNVSSSSFSQTETLESHLIARYFTTRDASYNAAKDTNDLIIVNDMSCYATTGAKFTGSNYAKIDLNQLFPNGIDYDKGFTITFTATISGNADSDSRFYSISDGTNSTNFAVNGNSSGAYVYNNSTAHTTTTNLANDGHHDYIISYANGNIIIYKDGELFLKKNRFNDGVMTDAWYDAISKGTLYIGALADNSGCVVGNIKDFCIYDSSLSYYDALSVQKDSEEEIVETAVIAVPETIYMTPSTGASVSGQYFVNNIVDNSGNLTLATDRADTTGQISIYAPGATAFSLNVTAAIGDIGDPVIGGTNANADSSYESTTWNFSAFGNASDYATFDGLYLFINGTGLTAGNTALIEWAVTLTYSTGTVTYYAYSTLYAPWYLPVGAATRASARYNYAQSLAWVSGVHGYTANPSGQYYIGVTGETKTDEGEYSGKGTYYAKTSSQAMIPLIYGVGDPGNTTTACNTWLSETAVAGVSDPTFRWFSLDYGGSSARSVMVADISPIANITVDTSRYTNFNQIPNLTVGFNVTDIENASGTYWYASDFTDVAHQYTTADNGTTSGKPCFFNWTKRTTKDGIIDYEDEWFNGGSTGNIYVGSATTNSGYAAPSSGVEYNSTYNRSIVTGSAYYDYMFKGAAHTYDNHRAYSINYVQLRATNVDKEALRELVFQCSGIDRDNYVNDFTHFDIDLDNAAYVLGNPTATQAEVDTALERLECSINGCSQGEHPAEPSWACPGLQITVCFDEKGGTEVPDQTVVIGLGTSVTVTPDTSTKTGYTLLGWSDESNSRTGSDSVEVGLYSDKIVHAVWEKNKYTITYDTNGGAATSAGTTQYLYQETVTIPGATKTGYTFAGWAVSGDDHDWGSTVNAGTISGKMGNVTLTAQWTANTYNVTFDNLIDFEAWKKLTPGNASVDYDGTTIILTSNATRTDSNGATEPNGEGTFESPYFAVTPGKQYKIDIDFEGSPWDVYIFFCDANGNWVDFADGPTNRYSTGGSTGVPVDNAVFTAPNKDTVVKAKIRLDANGANNTVKFSNIRVYEVGTVKDGVSYHTSQTATYDSALGTLPTPTRTGYTFTGWNTAANGTGTTYTATSVMNVAGTLNLYSQWSEDTYTITYAGDGVNVAPTTYSITDGLTIATAPTRKGYTFKHWAVSNATGMWKDIVTVNASTVYAADVPYGSATLTAQWTADSYSYTFKNGDTVVSTGNYTIEGGIVIPADPSKTGYTFGGWKVEAAVGDWSAGESVTTGEGKIGNVTFVAQWTPIEYKVSYNSNGGSAVTGSTYTIEGVITHPSKNPTKDGYTFAGWTVETASGNWTAGESVSTTAGKYGDVTFVANWTVNNYVITFVNNDGTGTTTTKQYTTTSTDTIPALSRTGYDFAGWVIATNGNDGNWTDGDTLPAGTPLTDRWGTVTLTAQWTPITYAITYDVAGGNELTGTYTTNYTITDDITLPTPTRTGYTFTGWKATNAVGSWNTTDAYKNSVVAGAHGDVELVAQWTENTYTIKFNANGGTGEMADMPMTYNQVANLTKNTFTRRGYTFAGWATSSNASKAYDDMAEVSKLTAENGETVTLYAVWTEGTYTVIYDANTGEGTINPATNKKYTLTWSLHSGSGFTKTGYTLTGWNTKADGTGTAYAKSQSVSQLGDVDEVITLYAQWAPNTYTIKFGKNSGAGTMVDITATYDVAVVLPENTFTRTGYTFTGWNTASDGSGTGYADKAEVKNLDTSGSITLYAQWKVNEYTINFVAGEGGSGTMAPQTMKYDVAGELNANEFTKTGFTFANWSDSNGKTYADKATVNKLTADVNGSITLTAQWSENSYNIAYNGNGATGGSTAGVTNIKYTDDVKIATNGFENPGYTFKEWNTEADGSGIAYAADTTVSSISATDGDTVTLYAQWSIDTYTITLVNNDGTDATTTKEYTTTSTDTLPELSRKGYKFDGWKVTTDDGNWTETQNLPAGTALTGRWGTVTLTAQWTPITYKVVFHSNNEANETKEQTFTYDVEANLEANTFVYEGYKLDGWATTPDVEVKYADAEEVKNLASTEGAVVDLYAVWSVAEYTITYIVEGKDPETDKYQLTAPGSVRDAIEKAGYTFVWEVTSEDNGTWVNGATINGGASLVGMQGNVELTAVWTPIDYTIKYDAAGIVDNPENGSYNIETDVSLPALSKDGYTFNGWKVKEAVGNWAAGTTVTGTKGNYGDVTFVADWTVNPYTVTLNANGGTGAPESVNYDVTTGVKLPTPERVGYTFAGWKADEAVGSWNTTDTYKDSVDAGAFGDVTLTAQWTATSYNYTLYKEDGTTVQKSGTYTIETGIPVPTSGLPSKTGYTFNGWKVTTADGNWSVGDTVISGTTDKYGDIVAHPELTPNSYTVIFNANGGEGTMDNQEFTYDVEQALNENKFTKTGYYLKGWATSATTTTVKYNDKEVVSNLVREDGGEITLYAVWTAETYTITYDTNGGEAEDADTYQITKNSVSLPNPTRAGYTFNGWKVTVAEGTWNVGDEYPKGTLYIKDNGLYGDVTLQAQWTPIGYTLKFNEPGDTAIDPLSYTIEDKITLPSPTQGGYTFGGWLVYSASATSTNWTLNDLLNGGTELKEKYGNVTLTGQWTANPYTIVFDKNADDATGEMANQTMTYDATKVALNANEFTRTNYTFIGWSTTPNGAVEYEDLEPVKNLAEGGEVTLYAVWKGQDCTISYYKNDSTSAKKETVPYGESYTLNPAKLTYNGYKVKGWETSPGGGIVYAANEQIKILSDITLYAVWEPITYNIAFDANGGTGEMAIIEGVKYDETVSLTANSFSKPGYTFYQWNISADGTGSKYYSDKATNVKNLTTTDGATVTLYAIWTVDATTGAVADKVAVDFLSQSIVIDVLENDIALQYPDVTYEFRGICAGAKGTSYYSMEPIETDNGTFTVQSADEGTILYTPKVTDVVMNYVDTIYYYVRINNVNVTKVPITVAPASNIYYEENVVSDKDKTLADSVQWTQVGDPLNTSIAGTDVYGYDATYDNGNNFSNESYLKVNVTPNDSSTTVDERKSVTKIFDFVGSGFDLISACGKNTGIQVVKVSRMQVDENGAPILDDNGEPKYKAVKAMLVDTYFSDTSIMTGDLLHQVPIVNYRSDWGTYQVEISATYLSTALAVKAGTAKVYMSAAPLADGTTINTNSSKASNSVINELEGLGFELGDDVELVWMDDNSTLNGGTGAKSTRLSGSANTYFTDSSSTAVDGLVNYIDGFRVYNPLAEGGNSAYIASEQNATYYNIVSELPKSGSNITYIENGGDSGFDFSEDIDFNAYNAQGGPKGEIYLKGGQGIAFKLDAQAIDNDATIMLGMRAVYDKPVVMVDSKDTGKTIVSKTEMYYDVSDFITIKEGEKYVTITVVNNGPINSVLAVNNLKLVNGVLTDTASNALQTGSNTIIGGNVGVPTPVVPQVNVVDSNVAENNAPETILPEEDVLDNTPETEVDTETEAEDNIGDETGNNISDMMSEIPTPVASFLGILLKLISQLVGSLGF